MSDDSTPDIVQRCNITELHHFDSHQKLRDDLNSRIKSEAWIKYDNYDWVICVDSDEFLYHPHIFDFLDWCEREKISVVTPRGYDMSPASTFPYSPSNEKNKISSLKGIGNRLYSKPIIFSPRRISQVRFGPGAHSAMYKPEPKIYPNSNSGKVYKVNPFPTSMIIYEESEEQSVPKLLHYRFHGMSDFTQRWKSVDLRRSDINIKNNFGTHYGTSVETQLKYYDWVVSNAKEIQFQSDFSF